MRKTRMHSFFQFLKFALVGVSNTIISEGFYFLFVYFGGNYLLGNFLGFSLSVINAYLLSNAFVFKKDNGEKRVWWKVLGKTYLAYLGVYVINALLLVWWVDVIRLENYLGFVSEWFMSIGWDKFTPQLLGKLFGAGINMILTVPLNFVVNKFWAYRNTKRKAKKMTPTLITKRLRLRPIRKEDVNAIFECWMQDEEVSRYMCWKASSDINETKEFVAFELDNLENPRWNRWMLEQKDTQELIGTCLIYFNEDEGCYDISYNLGRKYWGQGFITEAMSCVMEYAHKKMHIKECIAAHAIENPASGHVIEKLGFHFEKEIPYECSKGEIQTTGKLYRLIYEENEKIK